MIVYLLLGTSLLLSICALTVASFALRACGRNLSQRRMDSLETELAEMVDRFEGLKASVKRVASRESMREVRALRHQQREDAEVPEDREEEVRAANKRRTRKQLGVPENPVAAVLANLRGEVRREGQR